MQGNEKWPYSDKSCTSDESVVRALPYLPENNVFAVLLGKLHVMAENVIEEGYTGKRAAVFTLIDECRTVLIARSGHLGAWETKLLDFASSAVQSDFLAVALVAASKALAVSQLPQNEYDYGYKHQS